MQERFKTWRSVSAGSYCWKLLLEATGGYKAYKTHFSLYKETGARVNTSTKLALSIKFL
jgi:hypothetical protein